MIIKIDYDKTIDMATFPNVGTPVPGAIESIKMLSTFSILILDTCRHGDNLVLAIEFLKKQGIIFNYVCENDDSVIDRNGDSRKIYCDISIDDKNLFTPIDENGCVKWDKVMTELFDN